MQHAWSLDKHPLLYPGDGELEAREVISYLRKPFYVKTYFYRFSNPALMRVCLLRFSDFIYFLLFGVIFYNLFYKEPY